jgi:NAD(P)-dependent dehydrogenase (short-subunit alcohol dehydrogenase family)
VTNAFLPHLGAEPEPDPQRQGAPGKIINITSISGVLNTPINTGPTALRNMRRKVWEKSTVGS